MEQDKIKREYILITCQNFPVGGAGASYLNLFCRGLKMNGFSIRVLLLKGFAFGDHTNSDSKQNITEYGVPYNYLSSVHRPHNKILKIFDDFVAVSRLITVLILIFKKRKNTSILVFNGELQYNIPIFSVARLLRINLITFVPEYYDKADWTNSLSRRLKYLGFIYGLKYLYKRSDKLIVFSHFLKNEFVKIGYNESDIIIQPNLTDFDYWETNDQEIKYTIGYCGTPSIKDGLNDLFSAIKLLQNESFPVSLIVIGDAVFGDSLIPNLKTECQKLDILDQVTFTGLVDSTMVKKYLSECKILVITRPSTIQTKAGFPTKLGEYFAIRKPILLTKFGDIERYFEDAVDIILAECGNPESIAKQIKWMIKNSEALNVILESGYFKARNLLEYKRSVKRILSLIS
jgi:glycosyltransferase involved in cell wall biosynthesis